MVLFDIIHWKGYGMKLRSALLDEVIDLVGFGFVKDTDLVENGTAMKTIIEVANKLQKSIDWQQIGADASGGALIPEKN